MLYAVAKSSSFANGGGHPRNGGNVELQVYQIFGPSTQICGITSLNRLDGKEAGRKFFSGQVPWPSAQGSIVQQPRNSIMLR